MQSSRQRILILLRHAEAAAKPPGGADADRPLSPAGRKEAEMQGARLARLAVTPQAVLVSPAARTRETAAVLQAAGAPLPPPQVVDRLYLAAAAQITEVLEQLPPEISVCLLIGHNPGISELLEDLAGRGAPVLPTAGMATLAFDAPTWPEALARGGSLAAFAVPG